MTTTAAESATESLRGRVLTGVLWKATTRFFAESSSAVVTVILVRLLTPHEFGLAGMVLVMSSIVPTFSGLAFGEPSFSGELSRSWTNRRSSGRASR